jgi:fructose 1,6-bisphosphatase
MMEKHFHPMNHRLKVEDINTVDTGMGDRAAELEVVERESEDVVLMMHWIGDRAMRHN